MSTHRTEIATGALDARVQWFAYFIGKQRRRCNRWKMAGGDDLKYLSAYDAVSLMAC